MTNKHDVSSQQGSILIVTVLILVLLSILGTASINLSSTEMLIVRNNKLNTESFFDAEAGVHHTLDFIEKLNQNGTSPLPESGCNQLNITSPGSFSFQISDVCATPKENIYTFNSTGFSSDAAQSSNSMLKLRFQAEPKPVINFAAFGDTKLDTKNSAQVLSYNSNSTDLTINDPTSASFSSTGVADIGSNDWLITKNESVIDGNLVIGAGSNGVNGTQEIHDGTGYSGEIQDDLGRIDPDPLEVTKIGSEYNPATYASSNNNDSTLVDPVGSISAGNNISLDNKETLTLSGESGGANYYISDIVLKNGSELIIDTSNGPVNIYLTGSLEAKNGANVNVIDENGDPTYDATRFNIVSDTTNNIVFKNSSDFTGFVYAPYASIEIKNSGDVFGAIWGYDVDIKNSGKLNYDSALAKNHKSNKYKNFSMISWREL